MVKSNNFTLFFFQFYKTFFFIYQSLTKLNQTVKKNNNKDLTASSRASNHDFVAK